MDFAMPKGSMLKIEDGRVRRLGMRADDGGWVLVKERRRKEAMPETQTKETSE